MTTAWPLHDHCRCGSTSTSWSRAPRASPKVQREVQREVSTVQRGVRREVLEVQHEVQRKTSRAQPPVSPRAASPTRLATDRTIRASHGCATDVPRASRLRPRPRPPPATTTQMLSASRKARRRSSERPSRARLRRPTCRRRGCRRHCFLAPRSMHLFVPSAHPLRTLRVHSTPLTRTLPAPLCS